MPIGIEDSLHARKAHAFTIEQLLLISAIPVLLAVLTALVLLRGKNPSLLDSLIVLLGLIALNLFVGTLGLVAADLVFRSLNWLGAGPIKLYLTALGTVAGADVVLCRALRKEEEGAE